MGTSHEIIQHYMVKNNAKLPRNIYSICIRYLNNSLANGTNLNKWKTIPSPMCLFCNNPQTLGHVVASCVTSLNEKRYNFHHDSVLLNIVRGIQDIQRLNIYADIAGFKIPTLISGEDDRPDIIIHDSNQSYVLELTVGYETNMSKNSNRK